MQTFAAEEDELSKMQDVLAARFSPDHGGYRCAL
jgi:hypothetical protein